MDDPDLARLEAAVPANVRRVCERLTAAGHQAVTVGGAVRDALLDRAPGDWDVATSAVPEVVLDLFDHTIPTGLQHGTVTVVTGRGAHTHVEVTTFRGEGAYTDARRPDHVRFGVPLVEDLARRDLRVNAMAYDPARHELVDPFRGRDDLRDRVLRAVGPTGDVYADAVARFSEDGLRVMRAVRFAAQLEFALDPDTERGIGPALPSLAKVSRERVSDELRKILGARLPSLALAIAERTGIIAQVLPSLDASFAAWGDARTGAIADWCVAVDAAPAAARLAALVGEPEPGLGAQLASARGDGFERLARIALAAGAVRDGASAREAYDVVVRHRDRVVLIEAKRTAPEDVEQGLAARVTRRLDRADARRAEEALRALKFSNEEIGMAAPLAGTCAATFHAAWTEADVRRLLADVTRARAAVAAGLWRAQGAVALADAADAILARGDAIGQGELALAGKELMTELAVPQGPAIGRMLALLLERVLDDPSRNTRDQLIAIARTLELETGRG
ncbi:MAG: tRNA cytidylyltransferase [Deltaproteobacteria bacterium]|nr:tRNA cytidylyltransferase [Deltaproteobacteria bacterium]